MSDADKDICERRDCFVPELPCAVGHMQAADCPHHHGPPANADAMATLEDEEQFPWTGRPMGVVDVRFVSATRRPHLVGIAGAADAGKTTLLCLLFLALYRGLRVGELRFAGSYSLLGWENIARYMQLNAGEVIQFPPHTSSAGRSPGLLHIAVADVGNRIRDVLLTDASGEWFTAWTDKPSDETAAGARWIASRADKMMIIADTAALTGDNRGAARRSLEFLMRRVRSEFGEDGVALVWTKTDLERPDAVKHEIEKHFRLCFADAEIFETGIPDDNMTSDEDTLAQLSCLFSWAFEKRVRRVVPSRGSSRSDDPFLGYREAS